MALCPYCSEPLRPEAHVTHNEADCNPQDPGAPASIMFLVERCALGCHANMTDAPDGAVMG